MIETTYHLNTPVSIALLTDLHNRPFTDIISKVKDFSPDIIAIAGDVIYGTPKYGLKKQINVLSFFSACVSIAPTFFSLGNHEYVLCSADLDLIKGTGVIVLDNSFVQFTNDVIIGGLTSGRIKRSYAPETAWLDDFIIQPGYHILLSHHPEYIDLIPRKVDLVLSGHAHGGQIHLFGHGIYSPGQGIFPKYTHGVYDNRLVVSRGLSNTTRIPRINNPTEIVYIV